MSSVLSCQLHVFRFELWTKTSSRSSRISLNPITSIWCLLPLPRVPPFARRSTLLRPLRTPLTQIVHRFFGSRLFLLDASDSPSTFCRRVCGATAHVQHCPWYPQLSDSPESPPLCSSDLQEPFFPAPSIVLPLPLAFPMLLSPPLPLPLPFLFTHLHEVSHHPEIGTCRSPWNLVHIFQSSFSGWLPSACIFPSQSIEHLICPSS